MKPLINPSVLLLCFIACAFYEYESQATDKVPRQVAVGYLKVNAKGRTFFVRRPAALEPGVPVTFSSRAAEGMACKLAQTKPPLECPPQTISFEPVRKFNKREMTKARVENTDTPWHRLRSQENIFRLSGNKK